MTMFPSVQDFGNFTESNIGAGTSITLYSFVIQFASEVLVMDDIFATNHLGLPLVSIVARMGNLGISFLHGDSLLTGALILIAVPKNSRVTSGLQ
jgi:hypothetical protein